jgi:hypothetical protein
MLSREMTATYFPVAPQSSPTEGGETSLTSGEVGAYPLLRFSVGDNDSDRPQRASSSTAESQGASYSDALRAGDLLTVYQR